ncbi:penicillin-binding protein 1C [Labilibaculum sp. DW002]|uniref:peptidoglycan glycosyltransferase n=1 Tax=Paralabilibaculum antarcticum TaxID=2912572 RepID=A0ABT5VUS8_9BACT|nr:penicillin-binding protein 1C [Labilibaculum sp. DW002]MDE5419167.1 penicillin-binding protein 1C [Labilibaculum sp. DW002]
MNLPKIKYCQSKKCRIFMLAFLLLGVGFWFSIPDKLFNDPTSTILFSREGNLLGARIATDGQWRFPESKEVPEKFEKALLTFEDNYFYSHFGVNPVSMGRAFIQNVKAGRVVSGGSTLSMQLIRISRKGKGRTVYQKIVEIIKSFRLELGYSKKEILALYASHAPFGGNVVGLEAASWRFFGRSASELSWAEASTLAVLPNAPSLIYPGKNGEKLRKKRNRLLNRLRDKEIIDSTTCELAKLEDIPRQVHALPMIAPHLLDQANKEYTGERIKSSIQYRLQLQVNEIVKKHQRNLEANQIYNMAVLVLDVKSGQSIAYVGNTNKQGKENHANQVDVIRAPRSTGSILKPFLFASMLNSGEILPRTLVPDIPTQIAGYSPKNFNLRYDGAVPARKALSRSLNVPSVRMLRSFGVERFHYTMKKLGMLRLNRPSGHYGLSLILGGAEGELWNLCGIYSGLARGLKHYNSDKCYYSNDIRKPSYRLQDTVLHGKKEAHALLSAASIYQTFDALLEVNRPDGENGWKSFSSSRKVAWKTGTSFGFRDAWAIGTTPDYVVGVWVGNADGEGRPGLTGVGAAAPVMFDVFNILPTGSWFDIPFEEMEEIQVCRESGNRASRWCETVDTMLVCNAGLETLSCPFHKRIHLDKTKRYQVNSSCEEPKNMHHVNWFVLPPAMEWYYKKRNALYRSLPPFREDCSGHNQIAMEIIYPKGNDQIFVPVDLDGMLGKVVFEIAHHDPEAEVFWHVDGDFIGTTTQFHQIELSPDQGEHLLTLVDNLGNTLNKKFTIVGKEENEIN